MISNKDLIAQQIRYNEQIARGHKPALEQPVITSAIRKKAGRPRTKLPAIDQSSGFSQVPQ